MRSWTCRLTRKSRWLLWEMVSFLGHCKKMLASWFDLTQRGNVEISHWINIETSVSARWRGFPELLHLIIEKAFRCLCVHGSWWMNVENITISNKILSSFRVYIRPTYFLARYLPGGDKSVTALTLKPPWCRHHNFVMPPSIQSILAPGRQDFGIFGPLLLGRW